MSDHVEAVRRAIEFDSPPYVPMELVDVPHIYNAYDTCDAESVAFPPGAESFDAAWVTYHWTFDYIGKNEAGEPMRRDEWGCTQIIPNGKGSAYSVIEKPQPATMAEVAAYPWPDPGITDAFFESRRRVIERYYPDRFITGFLDPAPLLIAFNIFGYDGLLMGLHDDLDVVKALVRRVFDYQIALVPKFRAMGAHMINLIDEVAGTDGMMFSPDIFREHFLPMYVELLEAIHGNGMYTSLLLDGNVRAIMPDLMELELDQMFFAQPRSTGVDVIAEHCAGRRCVKLAVDMMHTLATGTTEEIELEVDDMVDRFHSDKGGLVFQALRWHRPAYNPVRVRAQINAMNKHRKGAQA